MRTPARLLAIQHSFLRYGMDQFLPAKLYPLRLLILLLPGRWYLRTRARARGQRVRLLLESLGPIWVKFGQILSLRSDWLPADIIEELVKLQDRVQPFDTATAQRCIESDLGANTDSLFEQFEPTPLASASLAQVHAAICHDGDQVVVKVLRPHIGRTVERDLRWMYTLARFIERHWSEGRRLRLGDLVQEYDKTIHAELNLMREAANAAQLRRNWQHSPLLKIPAVYWSYTGRNTLVMERIWGERIDADSLRERGVDMRKLAERGVEIFFTQVFDHNFFHADMHPGNVFVDARDPQDPSYIAVDFGIVGTLEHTDQHYLANNLLAFFRRDYRAVARLHIESGWVPPHTRVTELESAIRTVCEPIFSKPLRDISIGSLLLELFNAARTFDMRTQPQLMLLQKTLLNVENMGRTLYPELDLWETAKPFLERWVKRQYSVRTLTAQLEQDWQRWAIALPQLPDILYRTLHQTPPSAPDLHASDAMHLRARTARATCVRVVLAIIALVGALFFLLVPVYNWGAMLSYILIAIGLSFSVSALL